jgi:hypothetical protein
MNPCQSAKTNSRATPTLEGIVAAYLRDYADGEARYLRFYQIQKNVTGCHHKGGGGRAAEWRSLLPPMAYSRPRARPGTRRPAHPRSAQYARREKANSYVQPSVFDMLAGASPASARDGWAE